MSSKQSTTPAFELVYDSKKPTSLHARTAKECWAGHMRPATEVELKELEGQLCRHCVRRVTNFQATAKPAAKAKGRKFEPVKPTKPVELPAAGKVAALVDSGLAADAGEAKAMLVDMARSPRNHPQGRAARPVSARDLAWSGRRAGAAGRQDEPATKGTISGGGLCRSTC